MNIALISNNSKLLSEIAHRVALQLELFFVDAEDYIEYDLVEKERALQACSKEYLLQREAKAIETICSFENTLISLSENVFAMHLDAVKKACRLIYLSIPNKGETSKEMVKDLQKLARKKDIFAFCEVISLELSSVDEMANQVAKFCKKGEVHA